MHYRDLSTHAASAMQWSLQTVEPRATKLPFPFSIALVVRSASDLESLRKMKRAPRLHAFLRISGLPLETSKQWESKLNSSLKECGCSLGAKCALAGLAASLLWQTVFSLWSLSHWPVFFLRTLSVVLLAGGLGKSAGKIRARSEIRDVESKIRDFERTSAAGG